MPPEHAKMMEESPNTDTESSETAELPLSFAANAKEGDTLSLRVISVGDNAITVAPPAPKSGGSDGMAKEFDNQNDQEES